MANRKTRQRLRARPKAELPAVEIKKVQHRPLLTIAIVTSVSICVCAIAYAGIRASLYAKKPVEIRTTLSDRKLLSLGDLLMISPEDLSRQEIGLLNLRCAEGLPGSEKLNVADQLRELDRWAGRVRMETERNLYRFHANRAEYNDSEPYFRMLMLVTVLQQDFGVRYNPVRIREVNFRKPDDLFIHGLVGSENGGTCVSMPVIYTAVARKLGYPVFLVNAKAHIFCRWDSQGQRVNVEATNQGMNSFDDLHYMNWPHPIHRDEVDRGLYLNSLTMAESFAVFLAARGHCFEENDNKPDARVSYALAMKYHPRHPMYRSFLNPLVRPKTIEDFPEILAQQEQNRFRVEHFGGLVGPNGPTSEANPMSQFQSFSNPQIPSFPR